VVKKEDNIKTDSKKKSAGLFIRLKIESNGRLYCRRWPRTGSI